VVSGTNGFVVNAAVTDVVVVKGVDFDGAGTGLSGILVLSAGTVNVLQSAIRNFKGGGSGITLAPNNIPTRLFVSDTFIANNGNSATTGGIVMRPVGTGTVSAVIKNMRVNANTSGVRADTTAATGSVKVTVEGSSISGNANDGATAIAIAGGGASVMMINKSVVGYNSSTGVVANGGIVQLGDSVVTGNATGLSSINGGILNSYKNNSINGNTNDNVAAAVALGLN